MSKKAFNKFTMKIEEKLSPVLQGKVDKLFLKLPEMTVERAGFDHPLNYEADGSKKWENDGDAIYGAFFRVEGYKISNGDSAWFQPGLIEIAGPYNSEVSSATHNLVGAVVKICNRAGAQILLSANEPFKYGHKVLRPAVSTSFTKLEAVMSGETAKDPSLAVFLDNAHLLNLLSKAEWELADCANSGNRMGGEVFYTEIIVEDLNRVAKSLGGEVFTAREAVELLQKRKNLLNNHCLVTILPSASKKATPTESDQAFDSLAFLIAVGAISALIAKVGSYITTHLNL